MKKNIIFFTIIILSLISFASAYEWVIEGNSVVLNNSRIYFKVAPHTIYESTWVNFTLYSKDLSGSINALWGFNTTEMRPTRAEIYNPHLVYYNVSGTRFYWNVSNYVATSNTCEVGYDYNTLKREITHEINGETTVTVVCFDTYEQLGGDDYKITYNRLGNRTEDWRDIKDKFDFFDRDFAGNNKWFYLDDVNINTHQTYLLRMYVERKIYKGNLAGKYDFGMYPSSYGTDILQANQDNKLLRLDPWFNSTFTKRTNITITNTKSYDLNDFQANFTISYDANMQADFDDIRFANESNDELPYWIESKVDSSYAKVWVRVPKLVGSGSQLIYMYYGNANVSAASDCSDAMAVCNEDFTDTGYWTQFDETDATNFNGNNIEITDSGGTYFGAGVYKSNIGVLGDEFLTYSRVKMTNNGVDGHGVRLYSIIRNNTDYSQNLITKSIGYRFEHEHTGNTWNYLVNNGTESSSHSATVIGAGDYRSIFVKSMHQSYNKMNMTSEPDVTAPDQGFQKNMGNDNIFVNYHFFASIEAKAINEDARAYWGTLWVAKTSFPHPTIIQSGEEIQRSLGESCSLGEECLSGFCTDGVCCNVSCGSTCQACNITGSVGNCTSHTVDTDPDSECSAVNCLTGDCDGSTACKIYSAGEEGTCSTCSECSDVDSACDSISDNTQDTTGSNLCSTTCLTCNGAGSCVNQDAFEDLFGQCTTADCYTGDCDGVGACEIYDSGEEGTCNTCTECSDADSQCDPVADNNQDTTGSNLCNSICDTCNGVGSCVSQGLGEDLFGQCTTVNCFSGNCDGASACQIYTSNEEGTCSTCSECSDADSACDLVADDTQDSAGSNLCNQDCKNCDGLGACINQLNSEDLFGQCGGIQCDGDAGTPYYFGFVANTCYYETDISDLDAICDGSGACQTAAAMCPSSTQDGSTGVSCDCLSAEVGCTSTTSGSCTNSLCSTIDIGLDYPLDLAGFLTVDNITFNASSSNFYPLVNSTMFLWNSTGVYTTYANNTVTSGDIHLGIFNLPIESYAWNLYACDQNTCNWTVNRTLTVSNTPPIINNHGVTPAPAETSNNLTCGYTYFDFDNDPENTTARQIFWYLNDTMLTDYNNSLTLPYTETSFGNQINCELSISDSLNTSGLTNSSKLIIGDSTPPYNITTLTISSQTPCHDSTSTAQIRIYDSVSNIGTVYLETTLPAGLSNVTMSCTDSNNATCTKVYSGYNVPITIQRIHFSDQSGNWNSTNISQTIGFHTCIPPAAGGGGGGDLVEPCGTLTITRFEPDRPRKNAYSDFGFYAAHLGCNITEMTGQITFNEKTLNFSYINISESRFFIISPDEVFKEGFTASVEILYEDEIGQRGTDEYSAQILLQKSFYEEYKIFIALLAILAYFLIIRPAQQESKRKKS